MSHIVWYGERGVVNALVIELCDRENPVATVKALLAAVHWAEGSKPTWIDDVSSVTFLVEIGLGDFGNPDLVLICRTSQNPLPNVVFIEAKVTTYLDSAIDNREGFRAKGFSSSINGQLMLKSRFAHGLQSWANRTPVIEPSEVYHAYRRSWESGGLDEPASRARRLSKPEVLDLLERHGLKGLPPERVYYVGWTWDRGPFFDQDPTMLPLFLDRAGKNIWEETKSRVGWLGFAAIKEKLQPGEAFWAAFRTMVRNVEPPEISQAAMECVVLKTIGPESFSGAALVLVAQIEDVARQRFGVDAIVARTGSSGITIGGKVRVKLIPWEPGDSEYVLLGLHSSLAPQGWCSYWDNPELTAPKPYDEKPALIGAGRNRQPFFLLRLPPPAAAHEAVRVVDAIFQQLEARYRPDS